MTTRAFDVAMFVPTPANVGDGVVVNALGPPFTSQFAPLAQGTKPGITVGASMPAANAQNQILISGAGPGFAWALGTNPAAAAAVPPSTAQYQLIMADATPSWQTASIGTVLGLGGAVTVSAGGTFVQAANLAFTAAAALATRIDGGDPNFSRLDNFLLDSGVY
jgi:hypothetical protein